MKSKNWFPMLLIGVGLLFTNGCIVVREHPREAVITEAPPPPQVEVVPAAPGPDHVWIEGYWVWRGRWAWEPGRWALRPHNHAVWIRGHWAHRRHGWAWLPGRWR
ncbi:MAG: hypothetical protein DME18_01060 [Verrucomicrobia bacterium]|nr:MAG: hypothetical protein DME18_01060 [Verrucomicrobiota bacterium]